MKTFLTICVLLGGLIHTSAQTDSSKLNHEVAIDFGSFRGRYLYPVTNLSFALSKNDKPSYRLSIRARSYGTLFIYSKSAYDITGLFEYYLPIKTKSTTYSVGVGIDGRIRLNNDLRGETANSAEPLVSLTTRLTTQTISLSVPIWTRFYLNGISCALLPEFHYNINKHLSPFVRGEISLLTLYNGTSHEWRQDYFVGMRYAF